jgi:signal transduction histidine kinase
MLKICTLSILLFFTSITTKCQPFLNNDSLNYYLNNLPQNNIEKVKILYRISSSYISSKLDSSLYFAENAMNLAEKSRYDSGYFLGLKYRTDALVASGKTAEVFKLGETALQYADNINKQHFKGQAYFTMAIAKQYEYQIPIAINLYTKSITYFEQTNDKKNLSRVYQNTASLLYEQKAFTKGLEYTQKAIRINEQLKDTIQVLTCKAVYANLLYGSKKLLEASSIYRNIHTNKKFSQLNTIHQFILLHNLGAINYDLEKYDSSLYYFELAASIKDKYELDFFTLQHLCKTASTYIKLGNLTKGKALLLAAEKNIDKESNLQDYLEGWSEYYTTTKEYKKATDYLNRLSDYKDSVSNIEAKTAFAQMDSLLYDNEKQRLINESDIKIKTLEIHNLNKSKKINFLTLGTFILLLSTFLGYLYYRKKQQLKNKDIILLQQEKEFISVKSSLEGQLQERSRISKEIHDELGSSLTSISLLTEVLKKRIDTSLNPEVNKISDTSADMVDKMNEIIWALNTSNDTISSLIAYVRKFATNFLQEANIELAFLENDIPDHISIEGTARRNIYLTLKEAIHNIVKHSRAQKVSIQVDVTDHLTIVVKDDGKGINFEQLSIFGNGLTNMKKRIEDIGGTFSIENNNGTLIKLSY